MGEADKTKYLNIGKVLWLGFGFWLLFMAFNTVQGLNTQIFEQEGYETAAFYSLTLLYLTATSFNLLSANMVKRLGIKWSLVCGASGYVAYMAVCMVFSLCLDQGASGNGVIGFLYFLVLLGGFCCGLGSTILWVACGAQITKCSNEFNKSFFMGVFWSVLMLSQLLGNLVAGLVFSSLDHWKFYLIMMISGILGSFTFLFTQTPEEQKLLGDDARQVNAEDDGEEASKPLRALLQETIDYMSERDMKSTILMSAYSGLGLAYFSGTYPLLVGDATGESGTDKNRLTAYVLILLGVGEVLGGPAMGKLADKVGSKMAMNVATVIALSSLAVTYINYELVSDDFLYVPWAIGAFLFGTTDSSLNTVLQGICSHSRESPRAFSVFKLYQSLGAAIGFFASSFIKAQAVLAELVVLAIFVVASNGAIQVGLKSTGSKNA